MSAEHVRIIEEQAKEIKELKQRPTTEQVEKVRQEAASEIEKLKEKYEKRIADLSKRNTEGFQFNLDGTVSMDDKKREELVNDILTKDARIRELEQRPSVDEVKALLDSHATELKEMRRVYDERVEKKDIEYDFRIRNLETDIEARQTELAEILGIKDDYDKTIEYLREKTKKAYVSAEGTNIRNSKDERYLAKVEKIDTETSIYLLLLDYEEYRTEAAKRRSGGQKSIGTIILDDLNTDKPDKGYRL